MPGRMPAPMSSAEAVNSGSLPPGHTKILVYTNFLPYGMEVWVVYDNESCGLKSSHGFAAYLPNHKILFDTGWNGKILIENMESMGINPDDIEAVYISHMHWDHIGGLPHILENSSPEKVYLPETASKRFRNEVSKYSEVIIPKRNEEIAEGLYSTGTVDDIEQAMYSEDGVLIVGCSHPTVQKFISLIPSGIRIRAVLGGMHSSPLYKLENLTIVPCHCTEMKREMLKFENAKKCCAGAKILI